MSLSDITKSCTILVLSTCIGMLFRHLGFDEANIITVYVLGVLLTSVTTSHRIYSLISSIVSVLVFNFLFTEPQFTLKAYDKGYPVTFLIMFLSALLTSSLAEKLKAQALENERTAREKERAANLAKNEQLRANLLRSISHDLRTPLTSISGNASNLLSNGSSFDEETKNQLYQDIYDDSMWLISLVENLLSVTRLDEGRLNLNLTDDLVEDVITEAIAHVNRKSTEHSVTVQNMDDYLLARMDAKLMVQVIINIVDNAIKYTPKGSHIVIKSMKEDGKALISIADDGSGIPDEMKDRVFDMFYSGANSIADSRRSMGLGLSLCRSIVNAHGGTITLSDNVPHGAVFTIVLPAVEVRIHE